MKSPSNSPSHTAQSSPPAWLSRLSLNCKFTQLVIYFITSRTPNVQCQIERASCSWTHAVIQGNYFTFSFREKASTKQWLNVYFLHGLLFYFLVIEDALHWRIKHAAQPPVISSALIQVAFAYKHAIHCRARWRASLVRLASRVARKEVAVKWHVRVAR